MDKRTLTCIECPMGCEITAEIENGELVSVYGNGCPRGKAYASDEVICPKRVVTSTVRTTKGVPLPVKTDRPVKKSEIFNVMATINKITCELPVKIGDVLYENISDDANLVATANMQ